MTTLNFPTFAGVSGSVPEFSGFWAGIPEQVYHSMPVISKSGLDLVARSPAHYACRHRMGAATRPMEIGTATHHALLEPERFDAEYRIIECADKRAKEWRDATKQYGSGRCLTVGEASGIRGMQESIQRHKRAQEIIAQASERELTAVAIDPRTGVQVRCRYDLFGSRVMADLKTTRDARADQFARSVWTYRYHVQAALYSDIRMWLGMPYAPFHFIVVEPDPPHTVAVYQLDDDAMRQAREEYAADLDVYARCMQSGQWPGYQPETEILSLPPWAQIQFDDEVTM